MSRYIDADKLISHIKDEIEGCAIPVGGRANGKTLAYGTTLGLKMALSFAETLPTADAEQVKKALECCLLSNEHQEEDCEHCPFDECPTTICQNLLAYHALALITSQEQRIKELEQCWEHEHASAMEIFGQWSEKCERLTEENEKLRAIPEQMKERLQAYFGTYVLGYKIPLTEALKAVNQIAKETLEDGI